MVLVKEKIIPSLIENATVNKIYVNGVHTQYEIVPDEGFKLHDARLDSEEFDEETLEPTGKIIEGFTRAFITVAGTYDFKLNHDKIFSVKKGHPG